MKSPAALALTGFSLIAVTYGMARFSWGLMLPAVAGDIPLNPRMAGLLSSCSFVAYCLAILNAAWLTDRLGARIVAVMASVFASLGLLILACSVSPAMLATGLFIAGLSAGLASPSLAAAVSQNVSEKRQPLMNTLINAGTSAGIMLTVPVLIFLPGGWRTSCLLFALMALACLFPVLRALPGSKPPREKVKIPWQHRLFHRSMVWGAGIAFIIGMTSAAWWSFGSELLRHHVGIDENTTSLLWLVAGGAGILGAATGPLAACMGLNQVYRLSLLCMALPLLMLAFCHGYSFWLLLAVALCGAGYVTLSGVILVWGAMATKANPASGVGILFFMLAAGQVAGSLVFGLLYADIGAANALIIFCIGSLLMLFKVP